MIMYLVEKDFDSVTKNIPLKYSICKFDSTHAAKFYFPEKYSIMHKISQVSADFWNGCTKTQSFTSQRVLLKEQKDIISVLKKMKMVVLWTIEIINVLIVDIFFLKIVTNICSAIKFYLFNWRLETLFYFSQHLMEVNNIQRFHMFSQWQLMGGRVSKRGYMWSKLSRLASCLPSISEYEFMYRTTNTLLIKWIYC